MFFKRLGIFFSTFYKLTRVFLQLLYGIWRVSKLELPVVTIFGSHELKLEDPYALQAEKLAQMFAKADISVLTGGGAGIMEAANLGAAVKKGKVKSIGIGVKALNEAHNPYVSEYFELDYFFARKWLLTEYSVAFVVFPGGFGTLDELAEVLVLIKTKKLKAVPIVLIGKEFWTPFVDWIYTEMIKHGLLEKEGLALFEITDDLERAFSLVCITCKVDIDNANFKRRL